MVFSLAQWPNSNIPLDVDHLLLPQTETPLLVSENHEIADTTVDAGYEIPDELIPEQTNDFTPLIASIQIPQPHTTEPRIALNSADPSSPPSQPVVKKVTRKILPPVDGIHHLIRRGETLWDIAKLYGVEYERIQEYNPNVNPNKMQFGEKLFIPGAETPVLVARRSNSNKLLIPVDNAWIISGFGMRKHPLGGVLRFHRGIDLPVDTGTPVHAVLDGEVKEIGWRGTLGRYVRLQHNGGLETVYAHNSKIEVKVGDRVKEGRVISLSGNSGKSTGPHLHFEVIKNGKHVDPELYLPALRHSRK